MVVDIYYFIVVDILFYCVKSLNRSTDARCFVKWVGKIDKVIFCGAKYIKK